MKYIKLFEDFTISDEFRDKVNRLNRVLNLIGMSVVVTENGKKTTYRFNTNLNSVPGSMMYYLLKNNIEIDILNKGAFITDERGFLIKPDLTYYVSTDKEDINDPHEVCIRTPRGVNAVDNTIKRLMKLVIEHFDNCTDNISIYENSSCRLHTNISNIGKFITDYLKLNKNCKGDIILSKKMGEYFLKMSSADIKFYGFLKKYHLNIFNLLSTLNPEIIKSGTMSDMGFTD